MAVQNLYWKQGQGKRSAPTPVHSGLTTPAEAPDAEEAARMEVDADVQASAPTLLQPFSLQNDAALEVTVAALGINPSDHNAVKQWLDKPVASNRELFATMRAYHEQVIRPGDVFSYRPARDGPQESQQFHVRHEEGVVLDDCRKQIGAEVRVWHPDSYKWVAARADTAEERIPDWMDAPASCEGCSFSS